MYSEPIEKKSEKKARKFSRVPLDKKQAKKAEKIPAPKAEDVKIEKELEAIYRNGDGSMPDMADFEKKPRRSLLRALLVLLFTCVFFGAVVWAGFFIFQPQSKFNENDVILEITGDEQIQAGQLAHYRIRYRNAQSVPLNKANLEARYPDGFIFKEASQTAMNEKNDTWALGAISSQFGGYIDIYGYLYGNFGQKQSLRVFLNYYPSNFSSEFQKVAIFNSEIIGSPVEMEVTAPSEVAAGAEVEFTVALTKPQEPVKNLALVMEPGGNFNKTSSTLKSDKDNQYQWNFIELSDKQEIKIRGAFNPTEEKVEVKFRLLGWKDDNRQEDGYVFVEKTTTLAVLKTELSANLAINGSVADFTVKPGETLTTSMVLKNAGGTALKNLQARLVFETPSFNNRSILDWQQLQDSADGIVTGEQVNAQTRRGIITWTAKQIKALARLDPNKEINIDLSIPIKGAKDTDLTQFISYLASAIVEVKYENGDGRKLISSPLIKMTIDSDLSFEARHAIGVNGNNQEMHKVTWILTNSFHELKNIELRADIYNVDWLPEEAQVVPAGKFAWDKLNTEVVWKIDAMPTNVDVLALQFGLALKSENPSQTNLTSKVKITAEDAVTGQQIVLSGDEILLNQ